MTAPSLTTPLGDHTPPAGLLLNCDSERISLDGDHTFDHALTTAGCGPEISRTSAASTTLTTPDHTLNEEKGKRWKVESAGGETSRSGAIGCGPRSPPPMTGLTAFIIGMLKADRAALERASVPKLAARYDIPVATAAAYINMHLGRSN